MSRSTRVSNIHIAGETNITRISSWLSLIKLKTRELLPRRENILRCNTIIMRKSIFAKHDPAIFPAWVSAKSSFCGYCKPRGNGTKIYPCMYTCCTFTLHNNGRPGAYHKKERASVWLAVLFSITWEIIITMRNSTGIRDCNRNDLVSAIRLWKCARKGFAGKCICIRTYCVRPLDKE